MKTRHSIVYADSRNMEQIQDGSVDMVLTSPPYPMIEMWDEVFFSMNKNIKKKFDTNEIYECFILMHQELNKVWKNCYRVLKPGGIMAINIGDATRTIDKNFRLFTNHSQIIEYLQKIGMQSLPAIIWRKTSNKPNKFMGSGMLPTNAYVTLEHEYILIFRKGDGRKFEAKSRDRYESAYFWEERNQWFSDIWSDLVGVSQNISNEYDKPRERSAAFPIEIATRLIQMYSIYNDTILDPFLGTGTTTLASMLLKRNSIGYEIDHNFSELLESRIHTAKNLSKEYNQQRFNKHMEFIMKRNNVKHYNEFLECPVVTSQEKMISFYEISNIEHKNGIYNVEYEKWRNNQIISTKKQDELKSKVKTSLFA